MEYTSIIPEYVLSYGLGLLLVHGGDKLLEGTEDVGSADKYFGMERSKYAGVRDIFQGGGTGVSYIWSRDVGDEPLHKTGPGRVTE